MLCLVKPHRLLQWTSRSVRLEFHWKRTCVFASLVWEHLDRAQYNASLPLWYKNPSSQELALLAYFSYNVWQTTIEPLLEFELCALLLASTRFLKVLLDKVQGINSLSSLPLLSSNFLPRNPTTVLCLAWGNWFQRRMDSLLCKRPSNCIKLMSTVDSR